MDHVLRVGEGEPGRDLLHHLHLLVEGDEGRTAPRSRERVAEVATLEELHGHEDEPLLLAEVVHGHDVGMGEHRRRLGLALEALLGLVVAARSGGHGLDRHVPLEHGIPGFVDRAHGSAADLALDLVLPDLLQVHETEGFGL